MREMSLLEWFNIVGNTPFITKNQINYYDQEELFSKLNLNFKKWIMKNRNKFQKYNDGSFGVIKLKFKNTWYINECLVRIIGFDLSPEYKKDYHQNVIKPFITKYKTINPQDYLYHPKLLIRDSIISKDLADYGAEQAIFNMKKLK